MLPIQQIIDCLNSHVATTIIPCPTSSRTNTDSIADKQINF